GNFRVDNIRDASKLTALVMKEFVDHSAPVAQTLLGGPTDNPIMLDRDTLKLSEGDKNNLLRAFYKFGSYVHFKLFNDADPDLVFLIQQLEAFNPQGRVPRVLIRTTTIAFPWQILHVPQSVAGGADEDNIMVDENNFWGLKFDLSIDSLGRRNSGLPPSRVLATVDSSFMFGAYRAEAGASTNDTLVKRLAKQQAEFVKSTLKFNSSFIDDKRSDFMTHLKEHNAEVTFLGVFAHGSSGWIVVDLPPGMPTIQREAEGPRVMLATQEPVTPTDIENLPVGRVATAAAFLEKHPVVLLNACE